VEGGLWREGLWIGGLWREAASDSKIAVRRLGGKRQQGTGVRLRQPASGKYGRTLRQAVRYGPFAVTINITG
jgi:hypothetical protein